MSDTVTTDAGDTVPLVQLPWVMGLQNNSTAAINNLRRLGARRNEARAETQRIETQLGAKLEKRGFHATTGIYRTARMGCFRKERPPPERGRKTFTRKALAPND